MLIVLTNIAMYGTAKRATGLWLGELTHFYDEVVAAGFEVDFVSPFADYVVQDGRLITGQNPFSPRSVAKLLVAHLKQED